MLFQLKIKALCQSIHDSLEKEKLNDCFLVEVDFCSESFVIKAMKCLSNFINKKNSAKLWNRYGNLTAFIKPKKNMSLCLKDHLFNRLGDCAVTLLYHLNDITSFPDKF